MPPPLRATRAYEVNEELDTPACLLRPSCSLAVVAALDDQHASATFCTYSNTCNWGPSEHRIDAFQLRNEASFINDFREDVTRPDAAARSRRRPNCAVVTVIINGSVHALLWATDHIAKGREILLDYGEQYWQSWRSETAAEADTVIHPGGHADKAASRNHDNECRVMESHEPVEDRHAAWSLVDGHKDGWEWADISKPPPTPSLPLDHTMCVASVAAVQPRGSEDVVDDSGTRDCEENKEEVIFPACLFRSTTAEHRAKLMAAVKVWLRAGAGPEAVVMGRLTSKSHPAVAAAAAFASSKDGVASVQLGLFTRRAVAQYEILCEYQGVRLTSPVGCSPWRSDVPAGRSSYMLALATVAHWGGMRQALRTLPRLRVPHVEEAAEMLGRRPTQAVMWADHSVLIQQWCKDIRSIRRSDEEQDDKANESMIRTQLYLLYSDHNPSKLPMLDKLIDKSAYFLLAVDRFCIGILCCFDC
jgi:hypothetical protein